MMRRVLFGVVFVPCAMFMLGFVIGVAASEDPVEVG